MPVMSRVRRVALVSLLVLASCAGQAHAAFPGQDGRISFQYFNDDLALATMNANGTDQRRHPATALTNSENDSQPVWAPNGKIAFVRSAFAGSPGDLWVMNPDGSGQTRLTSGAADDQWPSWSPDSTQLAFSSDSAGPPNSSCRTLTRCNSEIFKLSVANPAVRTQLTS